MVFSKVQSLCRHQLCLGFCDEARAGASVLLSGSIAELRWPPAAIRGPRAEDLVQLQYRYREVNLALFPQSVALVWEQR